MVLVNLESLSTSELRNIAEQEGIEDFSDMDREELIMSLEEKYEEQSPNLDSDEDIARTVNVRNITSLSDNVSHSNSITELPGVEGLPESYQETSIHLLYKNTEWGYAFWSLSSLDSNRIEEEKGTVILAVNMTGRDGKKETYDILIGDDDRAWNIGFSRGISECSVSLVVEYHNGKREVLVESGTIHLPSSYWLEHYDEMKRNDTLFKVYFSLLTTKTGEVISNSVVRDIISHYREEDRK